ncbi:MAG: putative toxin-antitoxin system toxin component, PIN family [Synergistaceae bacterium]|nr:putative toxin-antitoxin system toxin component, PIN family [Synergistaceae bacterium]
MKIVLDTNVIASAMFFGGQPGTLVRLLVFNDFQACVSNEILNEYERIMEELSLKYPYKPMQFSLDEIIKYMEKITPTTHVEICRDPDDNKFIECAIDGKCIYIVSGDKDLLTLNNFNGVQIVTVSEFLNTYYPELFS